VVKLDLKKPATIATAIGLKGKGLIKLKVQNVIERLIRLEIVVSVKGMNKESDFKRGLIKGSKVTVRGPNTKTDAKTMEDLRVRRSNKSEADLLTKSKNKPTNKKNNRSNTNSQDWQKSNFEAQQTRFGPKTEKKKGYKGVQSRKSGSIPTNNYVPLNRVQPEKKRLEELLEAHLGIGL
jgi:acetyl/propionyl-CoA carboxylase alpha subunit